MSGLDEQRRGEEIARQKVPQVRGLSADTMAAVETGEAAMETGEAAIVDDDPQAEILEELGETAQWRTQHQ
ncbi:MAG: hypothetical protein LC721_09215 [Actinobacteria bacterium]|nr:hypothetical protein [Actinomycetota bacterium]